MVYNFVNNRQYSRTVACNSTAGLAVSLLTIDINDAIFPGMNFEAIIDAVLARKVRFALVFFLVFTATYTVLYVVDFLPEPIPVATEEVDEQPVLAAAEESTLNIEIIETDIEPEPTAVEEVEPVSDTPTPALLPESIYIPELEKTIPVLNPTSRSIADLDNALLSGVVRHPDSAALNQDGNVFILGHSSYLPSVRNPHFQAFNGIQHLEWGDTIEVTGEGQTYIYKVESVTKAKASEVTVPIADTGSMLTIATCNSFGSTDDRYIVEAALYKVESA